MAVGCPQVTIDRSENGGLLVGIDVAEIAVAAHVDGDADPETVSDVVETLRQEVEHSTRVAGGEP